MIRNLSILIFVIFFNYITYSQSEGSEFNRVSISTLILSNAQNIPNESNSYLLSKMNQILIKNGFSISSKNSRFVMTPNVQVISKEINGGAPITYLIKLEITFYIGDIISGEKFSSTTVESIGVGSSEAKAHMQAIKNVDVNNVELKRSINIAYEFILNYYRNNCSLIIDNSLNLAYDRKYEEAIFNLVSIPPSCQECYSRAMDAIGMIYKSKVDYDCINLLKQAKILWMSDQTISGSVEVGKLLSKIDPDSKDYSEVLNFVNVIQQHVRELNNKNWEYKWETEIVMKKDILEVYRDIAVAHENNSPQVIYNTKIVSWW